MMKTLKNNNKCNKVKTKKFTLSVLWKKNVFILVKSRCSVHHFLLVVGGHFPPCVSWCCDGDFCWKYATLKDL